MSERRTATFCFDVGSPWAWLAAERLARRRTAVVRWMPVLLGGIFKAVDRSSWALTDERESGMVEVADRAASYGLPDPRWPEPWPNDGLLAMRAATWADRCGRVEDFALAAMRLQFQDGAVMSDPENVFSALARCELRTDAVLDDIESRETKLQLRMNTDWALENGVYGAPTIVLSGSNSERVFWGDDRLDEALEVLRA